MVVRSAGFVLLLLGVLLLVSGINLTEPPGTHLVEVAAGRLSPGTVLFLTLGAIGVVGGLTMISSRGA